MLLRLYIKDFALINDLEIQFNKGLNVLTGETGAGKSIIIDAISQIIGERASVDFIRSGKQCAQIEAIFDYDSKAIDDILTEYGIDVEENTLLISRELLEQGRSVSRVNGKMVPLGALKKIGRHLIDIHGQHQHQSLLDQANHLRLLDLLGADEIKKEKEMVGSLYKKYINTYKRLNVLIKSRKEYIQYKERLQYEIDEIEKAQLKPNEVQELEEEKLVLENAEKIFTVLKLGYDILYKGYEVPSIIDQLNKIINTFDEIKDLFKPIDPVFDTLNSILYDLEDLASTIRSYRDSIDFDDSSLDAIISRLNFLDKLKSKYKMDIRGIIRYKEEAATKLDEVLNLDDEISKTKTEFDSIKSSLLSNALVLHRLRAKVARELEQNISRELKDLGMKNVKFHVDISFEEDPSGIEIDGVKFRVKEDGLDKIEFLISTNPGEPLKSLEKIVSGGEASRIMLALKSIMAKVDNIPCLIFDEIDAGIGGRTAQIVGEKLSRIALKHQVLCVTHSPQIASLGDTHFLIKKTTSRGQTYTRICYLEYRERVKELARMLGGAEITDNTINHANEMLDLAKNTKKHLKHLYK